MNENSAASQPCLRATVRKHFSGRHSFQVEADISVRPGVTILFGRSGAGKSTLLNCIAGIVRPDEGEIALERNGDRHPLFDSHKRLDEPPSRRKLGYVFQSLTLFPHLTVRQNVEYGISQLPCAARRRRSSELMELFHIGHISERRPSGISGGESQRVALARTLITEPSALLLDEPFSALDLAARQSILEDFRRWHSARQLPILYVTHSRKEALSLGKRMLLMEVGKIVAEGEPESVLAQSEDLDE